MRGRNIGPAVLTAALATVAQPAVAADAVRAPFGKLADGTAIEKVTLTNDNGMSVTTMALGASVQSLSVPDRDGKRADVVLGYDTPAEYLADPQYFGATVGRFANRIDRGRFPLDGKQYQLEINDGPNSLHGGKQGFDKRVWEVASVESGPTASVTYRYVSADGEGGYPGTVTATATYSLGRDNALHVTYRATTDAPTIVNMSNHSYWNLAGATSDTGSMDDLLTIDASAFTPVSGTLIPTGEIRPVAGTPFDFRKPTRIGARVRDGSSEQLRYGHGYDHNFVIDGDAGTMRRMARVEDSGSGRVMEVWSAAPGLQFYSGNFLDGTTLGKGQHIYREGDALVFEPQLFPDAPNHPDFPSARLDPGETYTNSMIFKFSVADD
ncbi:aldose epimerase family protein [Stakelama saccharophila]|uniref:Aldose 1-epimerase n=1 Tax=Stakelama saccharophila TaxID=3075605 RepID=A0ABZ0B4U1_9SPHN|nr:aldose epimerase family protein [Stakelama sp. W311]WNO52339.1 aldose epimerase family protein [Stakelama sp. W311]